LAVLENIAACVFDAYGTLYDFNSAAERCRAELGGKADELSALWRAKQLQYSWLRSLMGASAPFSQATGEALDISNGSPDMLAPAARHSGLDKLLEASLSVDAVKVYKPDRRVYQLACDHFHVDASRIAFFSSNGWDAHGAAHFGFKTVWLNRTGQRHERLPGALLDECRTLADLPALLGR
jgi:2-haloacid dehalogenase